MDYIKLTYQRSFIKPLLFGILIAVIVFQLLATYLASADNLTMENIQQGIERAEQMKSKIKLPEKAKNCDAVKAAEKATEIFHSDEFQTRVGTMRDLLRQGTFENSNLSNQGEPDREKSFLSSNERLYLFISSSIPKSTIRRYITTLEKIADLNVTFVMRGFIGGLDKAKPTLDFIREVLYKVEECDFRETQCEMFATGVNIDPQLFRRYKIERVPAVAYATGVNVLQPEMSEGLRETVEIGKSYTVYGDASFDYLLEQINKEAKSRSLEHMIAKLREGFFDEER